MGDDDATSAVNEVPNHRNDKEPTVHEQRNRQRQVEQPLVTLTLALRWAIKQGDADAAIKTFAASHDKALPQDTCEKLPQAMRDAVMVLTSEAGKFSQLRDALRNRRPCSRTFNSLLKECIRCKNRGEFDASRQFGDDMGFTRNAATWCHFLTGATTSAQACSVLMEASDAGAPVRRLLEVAAELALKNGDSALATLVLKLKPEEGISAAAVAALIRQRTSCVQRECGAHGSEAAQVAVDAAVLELYETHFTNVGLASYPVAYNLVLDAATRAAKHGIISGLEGPTKHDGTAVRAVKSAAECF